MQPMTIPGIDAALGIKRTGGNDDRYLLFLKRFPQDDTFICLSHALCAQDPENAFLYAHTLKGLSSQLGIFALSEPASALCELLRARNSEALSKACMLYHDLRPIYQRIIRDIEALD